MYEGRWDVGRVKYGRVEIYSRVFVGNCFRKFRIQWGEFFKRNDTLAGFVLVLVDVRVSFQLQLFLLLEAYLLRLQYSFA